MASRRSIRLGRACQRIGHATARGQCRRCLAIVRGSYLIMPPFVIRRHRIILAMVNGLVAQRRAIARFSRTQIKTEPVFEQLDKPAPKTRFYVAFIP